MKKQDTIPQSLIQEFRAGNVTLLIGSGISICAGLPSWSDLLLSVKGEVLTLTRLQQKLFRKLDPLQQAQYLYNECGRQLVLDTIVKHLHLAKSNASRIHSLIMALPFTKIVTTNWDSLFEDYWERIHSTPLVPIWKDEQVPLLSSHNAIIKIHGTVSDPASIVFAESDYYDAIYSNPLLQQIIGVMVATSTVLFLGYSFSDFDFKYVFNQVRRRLTKLSTNAYIFMPNHDLFYTQYYAKQGIRPIIYRARTKEDATYEFLRNLAEAVSVSASDSKTRMMILIRENRAMLPKAKGLLIRNRSNLGPLATPLRPRNKSLYGSEEITALEVEATRVFMDLLEHGASAKCILCLNTEWMLDIYPREEVLDRLNCLKSNLSKYADKVTVVDSGIPITSNIGIFGTEVCLESKKVGHNIKSYNRLHVTRSKDQVEEAVKSFDITFADIQKYNSIQAKSAGRPMPDFIAWRIDQILARISTP
jgi:hypothetical protein